MMKRLSWDTETDLFGPGRQAPPLSCVSWMQEGEVGLIDHEEALSFFEEKLADPNVLHVGHNIAYDMAVIAAEHPSLLPLIFRAYEENRVTDTMLRQMLLDNALGRFRGYWKQYRDKDGKFQEKFISISYSLDACYFRVKGKHLDKDTWRLRYGELRGIPISEWPDGARSYPLDDARATDAVFVWQEGYEREVVVPAYTRIEGGHIEDPQPLADQFSQARAAFWIQLMRVWGIKTDPSRVDIVETQVLAEIESIRESLIESGLLRADGTRNIKAAQERMALVKQGEDNCRKTKKGAIQLDEEACRESGDPILLEYAEISSLNVVLSKDLPALRLGEKAPIHSNFSSFVATGRTSSSSPNIQNIRRLPGIRECFVPRPGMVFLDADYDGLELRTLAQACMTLLGKSKLAEVINDGKDPHLMVAAQILKIPYDEAKARLDAGDKEVKNARQTGKVANFGFGGGLGADTFVSYAKKGYGIEISAEDAKKLKEDWLLAFPEMRLYFAMVSKHSNEDKEDGLINVEHLFTKRLRGAVTYTVACNSYFQGLGADATKNAGFLLAKECYVDRTSPLYGCRIVNYIHDQFLVECPEERCHEAANRLARVMEEGARPFLPDVPATVSQPMAARCWSKDVEQVLDERGRIIPWDTEFHVEKRAG